MKHWMISVIIIGLVFVTACGSSPQTDSSQSDISSNSNYIENKGSDTLVNLALAWAEKYQKDYPGVQLSVTGGGSGTGFAALINGTIDIANASREIKSEEIAQAEESGFEPIEIIVASDAIAVIVHPENPINELTLAQVSQIYKGEINNWQEIGGDDRPIVRLSRETNSGTHVYFLETVIRLGSKEDSSIFSADTLLLPSSEGIIAEVSDNPNAIGYDGLGYVTEEVKKVALTAEAGGNFILPSVESVKDGTYPVSRFLYMYTRGQPEGTVKDYIDWVLDSEAQEIVKELGFVPISN